MFESSLDIGGTSFFENPYFSLNHLRTKSPVFWSKRLNRWLITRYDDAAVILRDSELYSSIVIPQIPATEMAPALEDFVNLSHQWLFFLDPPGHGQQKRSIVQQFDPKAVDALSADIIMIINGLCGQLMQKVSSVDENNLELIEQYAHPIAAQVICGFLCNTEIERESFLSWCRDIESASLDATNKSARERGFRAIIAATKFVRENIEVIPLARNILSNNPDFSREKLMSHCLVLLFAGVETTQNLIGNLCLALLENPLQFALLQRDPSMCNSAVEEALRFNAPVIGVLRRVLADTLIRGQRLRKGDEIVVMIGAANRDPIQFPFPDSFIIERNPKATLAFGLGRHYCLGAGLARLTAKLAIEQLLLTNLKLELGNSELAWRNHDPIVRGLKQLPVKLLA